MTDEPHTHVDYSDRQVEAARRVIIDLGQVLGSFFADSIVIVGGWVPELLLPDAEEPHIGSIDVDLALDAQKLQDGRYVEIVKSLLSTGRYEQTAQPFKLQATVDLKDGGPTLPVDVDFLKPVEARRKRRRARLIEGFRPLDARGCAAAFQQPKQITLSGHMIAGDENRVFVLVASVEDFLVMKAFALAGRDKPKDAYDICYCLDHAPVGIEELANDWSQRRDDPLVAEAITLLRDKFTSERAFGPQQVVTFYDAPTDDERAMHARRAYELVDRFLTLIEQAES